MSISDYAAGIGTLLSSSAMVSSYTLTVDRKTADIASISGGIDFRDGAALDFKEFIEESERGMEKYKYAYNFRKGSNCIFRYDNARDPNAKGLKSFPHHKHLKDGSIVESSEVGCRML